MASAFRQTNHTATLNPDAGKSAASPPVTPTAAITATERNNTQGTAIHLEDVSKNFGDKSVLRRIALAVAPGEFIAIVGRSGCGKSTLLRLLAGLDPISAGHLSKNGTPTTGIDDDTRFMFQDARLLPWKSVLDNVIIGVPRAHAATAKQQALTALRQVGLEARASEWPSVLSGGQRQRVALARALVGQPSLLLFDEPLGALDALTRIEMQRLIEGLWRKQGFTAILVTHDVSEAVALADRVILIEEGEIALDTPISLARPRIKDSGFAYFEKLILDRVLEPESADSDSSTQYDI